VATPVPSVHRPPSPPAPDIRGGQTNQATKVIAALRCVNSGYPTLTKHVTRRQTDAAQPDRIGTPDRLLLYCLARQSPPIRGNPGEMPGGRRMIADYKRI
jgi:hypothetical protein